ncbi:MAG: IS3 family transposase [Planctomycetaceae bacterium]
MTDIYAAIVQLEEQPVTSVCKVLEVSRSAYHTWRTREASSSEVQDAELAPLVQDIFWKHKRRYGARRIAQDLNEIGHACDVKHVETLMRNQHLVAIQPKSFVPKTTDSRHKLGYSPNLLLETPEPPHINQLWVGDITYVPLQGGEFCYLATLMDRFSRRIIAWHLDDHMTEDLVLPVLHQAIREKQPKADLIHHTDRGVQYAGTRYRVVLRRAAIIQSMSRADNCYENAFAESGFGTLKTELEMTRYDSVSAACQEIGEFLAYYNLERKHSSLDYLSPHQFELRQTRLSENPDRRK